MLNWFLENYIEVLGVILSIVYLILSIKQNILLWPLGILSAVLYSIVFFNAKFYADMGLNVYYFFISIYGWITWSSAGGAKEDSLPVSRVRLLNGIILSAIALAIFFLLAFVLDRFTDSPLPYWDALTTSGSIVATWMLTRKILEHWIVWIFVDLISLGLYIYRGLYPTSILFLIYTLMAILGYYQWKKSIVNE